MPPRMFRVGPPVLRVQGVGTPQLQVKPFPAPRPVTYRPGFGDLPGNFPMPDGSPGNPVYPYNESEMWGTEGGAGTTLTAPPAVGAPPAQATTPYVNVSSPNAESDRPWYNPTTYATIPINPAADGTVAVLSLNYQRNSLIIQNNSSATAVGDVAPTLYIGFNAQPQVGQALALAPALGFYWSASDCPPRDTIYVLFGPFLNGGASVVIAGCVVQGTYAPPGGNPS